MQKPVAELSVEDFEARDGEIFRLMAGGQAFELKLVEVRRLGDALRSGGAFALLFISPPGPILRQATYPIEHPALGTLELFIVPLGPKDGANRYEAIFT
jgi:hypothetical protein